MKILGYLTCEIILASVAWIEIINEYMRVVAAIAATVTLVFAVIKFVRDERDRKRRNLLLEEQIKNEILKQQAYDNDTK